jgi:hypothetical protein
MYCAPRLIRFGAAIKMTRGQGGDGADSVDLQI